MMHSVRSPSQAPETVTQVEVDHFGLEIGKIRRCIDTNAPVGIGIKEALEARCKPADRETGAGAHRQLTAVALAQNCRAGVANHPESTRRRLEKQLAVDRQAEPPVLSAEQPYAPLFFQLLQLLADGRCRDPQFRGGKGNAACTGDRLEIGERVEVGVDRQACLRGGVPPR